MSEVEVLDPAVEVATPAAGLEYAVAAADTLLIAGEGDLEIAAELLAQITKASREVEAKRLELTKPLNGVVKKINAAAKETSEPLNVAGGVLRLKITNYRAEQKAERARLEAEAQAETKQRVVDPGLLPSEVGDTPVKTSTGAVGTRRRWTFEVEDLHELVRAAAKDDSLMQFLNFAPSEIGAFVKAGGRELPGVRIYETESVVVR